MKNDDVTRAFRRVLQRDAIPTTDKQCLTVQISSKLNKTVPISRRLTVWAQPPQITILTPIVQVLRRASVNFFLKRVAVRRVKQS